MSTTEENGNVQTIRQRKFNEERKLDFDKKKISLPSRILDQTVRGSSSSFAVRLLLLLLVYSSGPCQGLLGILDCGTKRKSFIQKCY